MKPTQKLALICLALTTLPVLATTFKLDANGQDPLYRTELPKIVYQESSKEHLQDLFITNAAGEQVPYALLSYEQLHQESIPKRDIKPLFVYPIHEHELNNPIELSVKLKDLEQLSASKTTMLVINAQVKNSKNIYLIDAGENHPALLQLSVDWKSSENVLLPIDILASNDLKSWSNVGHAVLLKTSTNNNNLLQNTITLDQPTKTHYLQIRPAEGYWLTLTNVSAEYSLAQSFTPYLIWQDLQFSTREQNKAGQINLEFEALGHYPASRLQVKLPQTNTITNVTILVRNKTNEPWTYLTNASIFHITQHDRAMHNPEITFNPTVARYWKLQFNQANGGLGAENPTLSLGWLPETIVWNARGNRPFALHVGERSNIINTVSISNLLPDYKIEKVIILQQATLIPSTNENTNNKQSNWTTAPDYKSWLLWSGLLLSVLLLASMAYSLFKKYNQ